MKRKTLGTPPSMEEASTNLNSPESIPATAHVVTTSSELIQRIDGRSARRTNRTLQFATRVRPEWDADLRELAQRDGLLLVEVLERALELYKSQITSR
ncbi:hypothetical protein [Acidithiobacillus sp. IBUN Pt1247-S3]|uniref:hypothetical protein n=1 Tax=Acidithiobacillus sp. IBUN Pt1247-S3 TaxID=3166642 RepID=UPI0034E52B5D